MIQRVWLPACTRAADAPSDARGLDLHTWRLADLHEQCEDFLHARRDADAPLSRQRIWTPRDSYGWRG